MLLYVILTIAAVCLGMAISVQAFGTGGKRKKIFQDIYFSVEDVDGIGVLYTKTGEYSAMLRFENPVQKYSADIDSYYEFTRLFSAIAVTLGEGYAMHKQDVFVKKQFRDESGGSHEFLSDSYFRYFNGREYTDTTTYLTITQENRKSHLMSYDGKKWRDFLVKIRKVQDQLGDAGIKAVFLGGKEASDAVDRFFAQDFKRKTVSMTGFKVDEEQISMGDRKTKVYSLIDVDTVSLPSVIRPYTSIEVNNTSMPVDIMSLVDSIPGAESVVYNQMIFIPNQKRELSMLDKKKNRHASMPSPSNQIAVEDIKRVQEIVARESRQLVFAHYNLVVTVGKDAALQKCTNHLENAFGRLGIHISKRAYNQLELFVDSFPGNCYSTSEDYDRFLTLGDAACCLMYKERPVHSERTPLKVYYTDRQGVPVAIDITGKEGSEKFTDNANFFCLGPSGSGKSFHINSVVRQLREQDTDIVMVDTGDSYEGLCEYFGGTYITYSKEKPISMNPFSISPVEYRENFGEKKNFLKSLIFLIFKGSELPTKIEDTIINQVIVEYYDEYFHPFTAFTDTDREKLRKRLLLEDKKSGEFERYEQKLEEKYGEDYRLDYMEDAAAAADRVGQSRIFSEDDIEITEEDARHHQKVQRKVDKLRALSMDSAASEGEKIAANRQLLRLTPELLEGKYLARIERKIDRIEHQRKKRTVRKLSFNSFYEFALERIPQIMSECKIDFDIDNFAAILKPFYEGGELEATLNNDVDASLFEEKFIVFEIDKIKDDPVLFPIVVLIIMDVFLQKMRIKKGRKALIIEEAWKAISSPTMAEYIKYLYKTVRKFHGIAGVVTQELNDVIDSPIVKEAIINNSDVMMLLDQSKFRERFDTIQEILGLTDVECKKIFTINRLENKDGRAFFREVFIRRGTTSNVYGVEEPRECYMTYTTERAEKEALKLYKHELKCSHQQAIEAYCRDWKKSKINKSLEFAQMVNKAGKVLNLK